MSPFKSLLIASIVALAVSPAHEAGAQDRYDWVAKLTAADGQGFSGVGATLAASGNTVVMGENCSQFIDVHDGCSSVEQAAYVYRKPASGWRNMVQVAKLTPSDGFPGDRFGSSVAISGDTIVVGGIGKAYVYVETASGWKDMKETAQLRVPASVIPPGFSGLVSASIDHDTIVVGNPYATVGGVADAGAAFVFEKPCKGWAPTTTYTAKLTASDLQSSFYAIGTAIEGGTIVVSAPNQPNEVYVFQKPSKGWKTATQTAILSSSNPGSPGYFGDAIAVSGDTIVVGNPGAEPAIGPGIQGVADIFVMPPEGWVDSTETAELSAPDDIVANFGVALAFDCNRIAVGTFGGAKAFVYEKPKRGGWQSTAEANATLAKGTADDVFFGLSIALADEAIVVGDLDATDDGRPDEGAGDVFAPAW
jgi:hypothetical protein